MPYLKVPVNEQDHIQGALTSPAILVEYGDYQCGLCKLVAPIIKLLHKELGEKFCFVFRHFPLKESHPYALEAAKAAEAAHLQGKFWEMHELLYSKQLELNSEIWLQLAEELKLNIEKFKSDFHSPAIEQKIQNEFNTGLRSGVNGIPCFYINGERYNGDASYDMLRGYLQNRSLT